MTFTAFSLRFVGSPESRWEPSKGSTGDLSGACPPVHLRLLGTYASRHAGPMSPGLPAVSDVGQPRSDLCCEMSTAQAWFAPS